MNRTVAVAAAVLLAVTLTGCAGTVDQPPSEPQEAAASASSEPEQATSADASVEAAPELTELEREFVSKETWKTLGIDPADMLNAIDVACAEFAAGKTTQEMTLPGVPAGYTDYVANSAHEWFCPEN